MTLTRFRSIGFTEWYYVLASYIGTALPREIKSPFIIAEVFQPAVSMNTF